MWIPTMVKTARLCMETGFDGVKCMPCMKAICCGSVYSEVYESRTDQYETFDNRYRVLKKVVGD